MSYDEKQLSAREPFTEDELATYRTRLRFNVFRQLRTLFRRRQQEDGLTQKELARRLSTDEALISRRLKGETNLTMDTLCDLARGMGARLDVKVTPLSEVAVAIDHHPTTSSGTCTFIWPSEDIRRSMHLDVNVAKVVIPHPDRDHLTVTWGRYTGSWGPAKVKPQVAVAFREIRTH